MSDDVLMAPASVPGAECRIEALHDNTLILIISHLFARQAVQTCVLSWLWRNLWRSVPRINILPDEFYGITGPNVDCDVVFKTFVDSFFMLRNPSPLDEFQLWYNLSGSSDYSEDANLWIRHALECNALSVKVTIRFYFLRLAPAVFASGRNLTMLHLSSVRLPRGSFRQLEANCRALKLLFLDDCCIYDVEITSTTLKVLTIDNDCRFCFDGQPCFSIPSLVYLSCTYLDEVRIPLLKNMESLEAAFADINKNKTKVDDIPQSLKGLSGVTDLNLEQLRVERYIPWCPKFNNLTTLKLGRWCLDEDFYPLTVFLQNSPNLKHLTLSFKGTGHELQNIVGELEERFFSCDHLHSVDFVCSKFSVDEPVFISLQKLLTDNDTDSREIRIRVVKPCSSTTG